MIDEMAEAGVVGEFKGSQAREVVMTLDEWDALKSQVAREVAEGGFEADRDDFGESGNDEAHDAANRPSAEMGGSSATERCEDFDGTEDADADDDDTDADFDYDDDADDEADDDDDADLEDRYDDNEDVEDDEYEDDEEERTG